MINLATSGLYLFVDNTRSELNYDWCLQYAMLYGHENLYNKYIVHIQSRTRTPCQYERDNLCAAERWIIYRFSLLIRKTRVPISKGSFKSTPVFDSLNSTGKTSHAFWRVHWTIDILSKDGEGQGQYGTLSWGVLQLHHPMSLKKCNIWRYLHKTLRLQLIPSLWFRFDVSSK